MRCYIILRAREDRVLGRRRSYLSFIDWELTILPVDKSIMDQRMDGPADAPTDRWPDARMDCGTHRRSNGRTDAAIEIKGRKLK